MNRIIWAKKLVFWKTKSKKGSIIKGEKDSTTN